MVESGSYTPETIARRLKMAEMLLADPKRPITHWAEGLNELAKGYFGGKGLRDAERMQIEGEKGANEARLNFFGLGGQGAVPAVAGALNAPPVAQPVGVPGAARPVQVIEGNAETQPSPLDPPSGADRDIAVRTMYGEDPGVSAPGVANVLRRRAIDGNFGGNTLEQVAKAPGQFEPWARPDARARMEGLSPDSPTYKRLAATLDAAYAPGSSDPTAGATHFFAPKAQAALGRNTPAWAQGPSTTIGPHAFYGGTGKPEQAPYQVAGPAVAPSAPSPEAAPIPPSARSPAPAVSQTAPTGVDIKAQIAAGLRSPNPYIRRQAAAYADQFIQKELFKNDPKWEKLGKDDQDREVYGFVDPSKRAVDPRPLASAAVPGSPAPSGIVIPAPPPGADPKKWREEYTTNAAKNSASAVLPGTSTEASGMRKELQDVPSYKNISQAAPVYKSMVDAAGRDTRAADVNLIYGMAKIMDPGSVVRESEMTVAQAVATLPQQLRATIESQLTASGRLSPDVRAAIMQEAHSRMQSYSELYQQDMTHFRGIAERNRLNPSDVIREFGKFDPWSVPKAAPAPSAPAPTDIEQEMKRRGLR